jgi:Mce-associated membrane protein
MSGTENEDAGAKQPEAAAKERPAGEPEAGERPGGASRKRRLVRRGLAGLGIALALAVCATGTWAYAAARTDDDLAYGRARDAALAEGRAALATLTTLDASSRGRATAGVARWKAVSAGPLRTELARVKPAQGASSRGTVTDAALTALDTRAGTARLIATLKVETTARGDAKPTTDRKRLEAVLTRGSSGKWKVKGLSAVAVSEVTR